MKCQNQNAPSPFPGEVTKPGLSNDHTSTRSDAAPVTARHCLCLVVYARLL